IKPVAVSKAARSSQNVQGWVVSGPGGIQSLENGTLQVDARGIYTAKLPKAKGALQVRLRAKIFKRAKGSLFWDAGNEKRFGPDRKVLFDLVADGAWHDYEVDFTATAPLGRLRIDLGSGQKRRAEIEWIKLCSADGSILAQWTFTDGMK
ncbi:MAG: hypothetical protein U9P12_08540, partial [Verrucomicrobiota bacterium]|nr:hypothetical protein [Verrucomicrobiota bacterium]